LKIVYLINEYPKVSHTFVRREIRALERRGFDILRIAIRGWDGTLPDAEDRLERRKTRYVLERGAWPLLLPTVLAFARDPVRFLSALALVFRMARRSDRSLAHHLAYLAEACRILPWLKSFGGRCVHAHFGSNAADVALFAAALGGPPFSVTVHGPEEFGRPVNLREKILRARFVVGISSFGRSQLCLWADRCAWPKINVVHCGLERSFYEGAPPIADGVRRLVCVGRLIEPKGQALLIEATARLLTKGIVFELVLAGDGPERGYLESRIDALGLRGVVRITGWISSAQVRDEVLAARALVLPSFSEGLSVVVMEAMSLRRPVLTTYVGGQPELVLHGENGWLFPASSIDALADAMEECLAAPLERLREMGERAHQRVVARHDIDQEAGKLASLFQSAVGHGAPMIRQRPSDAVRAKQQEKAMAIQRSGDRSRNQPALVPTHCEETQTDAPGIGRC
jgi:glycosyltransferase involved in cell wall biosynthesis